MSKFYHDLGLEQIIIDFPDAFDRLTKATRFETLYTGRSGGIVTDSYVEDDVECVPLVRSTTPYTFGPQRFSPVHTELVNRVMECRQPQTRFNNIMVEQYTGSYTKMGPHTDQMLDLLPDSCIAIFSCYKTPPSTRDIRRLNIIDKTSGKTMSLCMPDQSVIILSTAFNVCHRHCITLPSSTWYSQNTWLGATMRCAKTLLTFSANMPDASPYFYKTEHKLQYVLDDDPQCDELFELRRFENATCESPYTRPLYYTMSPGDMIKPQ